MILFILVFFTWTDHVYLTLNTKDKTYALTVYVFPLKGTYDETNADYRLWYWAYPTGIIMEKTDSSGSHIANNIIGSIKLVHEDNSIIRNGHKIQPNELKFVPEKG